MNPSEFQNRLLKNYEKHRGPFNWLASENDLDIYSYLSSSDRKNAIELVYSNYADTIANVTDKTSPVEKIFRRPVKFQEFFELIVCATLIRMVKENSGGTRFCVGDCLLPPDPVDTAKLKEQFAIFQTTLPSLTDAWVEDLKKLWGYAAIVTWTGRQIAFLEVRQKSFTKTTRNVVPIRQNKDDGSKQRFAAEKQDAPVDPYSIVSCDVVDCANVSVEAAMSDLDKLVGL